MILDCVQKLFDMLAPDFVILRPDFEEPAIILQRLDRAVGLEIVADIEAVVGNQYLGLAIGLLDRPEGLDLVADFARFLEQGLVDGEQIERIGRLCEQIADVRSRKKAVGNDVVFVFPIVFEFDQRHKGLIGLGLDISGPCMVPQGLQPGQGLGGVEYRNKNLRLLVRSGGFGRSGLFGGFGLVMRHHHRGLSLVRGREIPSRQKLYRPHAVDWRMPSCLLVRLVIMKDRC